MIHRRRTCTVTVGGVRLGSRHPIVLQSMTKVATTDVERCLGQIRALAEAGCGLVRVAVPRRADTQALAEIVRKAPVPIIADIHFSPDRAVEAIEAGAAKIRLNPGNIKKRQDVFRIIDAAKMHRMAIRIGINEASIRDLQDTDIPAERRTALMLREMKGYIRLFESRGFDRIVLSIKSSDPLRTIGANRRIAEAFRYPIHLGLTHAGLPEDAQIPSAVVLGTLLAEGIGDTIRVSAAGDPVVEAQIGRQILIALGLAQRAGAELIVCPTCGRAEVDVAKVARQIRKAVATIHKPVRIAVMGCVVNGPGEAADADVAVCAAKGKAFLYRHGRRIGIVPEAEIIPAILRLLNDL